MDWAQLVIVGAAASARAQSQHSFCRGQSSAGKALLMFCSEGPGWAMMLAGRGGGQAWGSSRPCAQVATPPEGAL